VEVQFNGLDAHEFNPQDIESIDFFVRARGNVTNDEYDELYAKISRRVDKTFSFPSSITLEITPVYTYSLNLNDEGNTN